MIRLLWSIPGRIPARRMLVLAAIAGSALLGLAACGSPAPATPIEAARARQRFLQQNAGRLTADQVGLVEQAPYQHDEPGAGSAGSYRSILDGTGTRDGDPFALEPGQRVSVRASFIKDDSPRTSETPVNSSREDEGVDQDDEQ